MLGVSLCWLLVALRRLPVCRLLMLFVLEYRPPINSSVSNENTLKCLVQFFFLAATGIFSIVPVPSAAALLFLLRLMQKKISAIAASTATTIGTAMAACFPEEDMVLASACKLSEELLAALDAVAAVEEPASLGAVAVAVNASEAEDADTDCCDALALEAAATSEGVVLATGDVIVLNVVDWDKRCEAEASELIDNFDLSEAPTEPAAAEAADEAEDSAGVRDVKMAGTLLNVDAIDAKLAVSIPSVGVYGEGPEKLWDSIGEGDILDYVFNRLIRKGCRPPWRST